MAKFTDLIGRKGKMQAFYVESTSEQRVIRSRQTLLVDGIIVFLYVKKG